MINIPECSFGISSDLIGALNASLLSEWGWGAAFTSLLCLQTWLGLLGRESLRWWWTCLDAAVVIGGKLALLAGVELLLALKCHFWDLR